MSSYAIPPEVSDNFTQDEIQEYVSQFKEIDEDGNGTLDKNEMTELMKSLGMEEAATPDKVQALINEVDQDVVKKKKYETYCFTKQIFKNTTEEIPWW